MCQRILVTKQHLRQRGVAWGGSEAEFCRLSFIFQAIRSAARPRDAFLAQDNPGERGARALRRNGMSVPIATLPPSDRAPGLLRLCQNQCLHVIYSPPYPCALVPTFVELLCGCLVSPKGWVTRAISAITRDRRWTDLLQTLGTRQRPNTATDASLVIYNTLILGRSEQAPSNTIRHDHISMYAGSLECQCAGQCGQKHVQPIVSQPRVVYRIIPTARRITQVWPRTTKSLRDQNDTSCDPEFAGNRSQTNCIARKQLIHLRTVIAMTRFTEPPPLKADATEVESIRHLQLTMAMQNANTRWNWSLELSSGYSDFTGEIGKR